MDWKEQPVTDKDILIRRHHLPHWQIGGSTYFITFRSARGPLPEAARRELHHEVIRGDGGKYEIWFGVIMPDHFHALLRPLEKEPGRWWDLSQIMKAIKGASARRINQALKTQGKVWQEETFDRLVRNQDEFDEKMQYLYNNPVKSGLVTKPEDYPFFIDRRKEREEEGTKRATFALRK